ncbi:MAG: hypothetical protein JST58_19000 [Bacteroidetes bacterium]|nr:hypothetical protein [Bacteroidota bacterium]
MLKGICFYAAITLIADFLLRVRNISALIISFFAIAEFLFFSYFLFHCLEIKKNRTFIVLTSTLICFIEIFLLIKIKANFDFWVALINTFIIVSYSILYFYEQVNSTQETLIYESYKFWVVAGCIIYLSGTLFVFLYTSGTKDKDLNFLWGINVAFEMIKYILFSIAFIIAGNYKTKYKTRVY